MKRIYTFVISTFLVLTTIAQEADSAAKEKIWTFGGLASLNFTQVSLTNWAAGGQNSISGVGLFHSHLYYKKKKHSWKNDLDLAYGLMKQGKDDLIKIDDRIEFASKYGYKAAKNWNYSALTSFKSQFTEGYNYPNDSVKISNFMAPAYILASIGMDYNPNEMMSLFISPVTGKFTIVNDDTLSAAGAFGVEPNEKIRTEFGGYLKFTFIKELMKNVNFQTKLELFSNYLENPQNIDVNWETLISFKINEYISTNISTQLIYDDDINIAVNKENEAPKFGPRTQFKEVLSIGLAYKF